MTPRRVYGGLAALLLVLAAGCSSSSGAPPRTNATTITTKPPAPTETTFGIAPVLSVAGRPCAQGALIGNDGQCYTLGPIAVVTNDVLSSQATPLMDGTWAVQLQLSNAAFKAFNTIASECYAAKPACPTKQIGFSFRAQVLSAPIASTSSYKRNAILITGKLTEGEAKNVAGVINMEASGG